MPINQRDKYAILPWGNVEDNELRVFIDAHTFINVKRHAQKRTDREVGGFFIGDALHEKGSLFVQITHTMEVQEIQHKSGEFIFTHEVWKIIDKYNVRTLP